MANRILDDILQILEEAGIHAALRFLNERTPHRYTGVYRYDGEILRNLFLVDRSDPSILRGEDAPMQATFCSLVRYSGGSLEILDAECDKRVKEIVITPVLSYCGVLISDPQGEPFGTLCHFDMHRCEVNSTEIDLMSAVAKEIYAHAVARI